MPEGQDEDDFEFSDLFGPNPMATTPSSSRSVPDLPEIIRAKSHSLVGPSPRYPRPSPSSPFSVGITDLIVAEVCSDGEEDEDVEDEKGEEKGEKGKRLGVSDFEIIRVVGRGAFGKVFLVRKKVGKEAGVEREVYAMKLMRKDTIIKKNQVEYMKVERDILTRINHPFIVQLRYSFQTKSKLYLVLDFISGGHLFFQLYRQGLFR